MKYKQTVQLRDFEDDVVADVELPATAPTPQVILLNGIAHIRQIDLLVYRATAYMSICQPVNEQVLIDEKGDQIWRDSLTTNCLNDLG